MPDLSKKWFMKELQKKHVCKVDNSRVKILMLVVKMQSNNVVMIYWLERNERIFKDRKLHRCFLWDRVVFLASLWAKAARAFPGTSLVELQRDDWRLITSPSQPYFSVSIILTFVSFLSLSFVSKGTPRPYGVLTRLWQYSQFFYKKRR